MLKEKKKKKKGEKENEKRRKKIKIKMRNDIFMYSIFLYLVLISTFESYLFGVFIIEDLCEVFTRVFIHWVTFSIHLEC